MRCAEPASVGPASSAGDDSNQLRAIDRPAVPIALLVGQIRDACRVARHCGTGVVYSWNRVGVARGSPTVELREPQVDGELKPLAAKVCGEGLSKGTD